jgi:signal transduction histidine kinase
MQSDILTAGAAQDRRRTVEELEGELAKAHRREVATAEVLHVISKSPNDVQPVFDTIASSAVKLCDAIYSSLLQFDGEMLHWVAQHNITPEALEAARRVFPARPTRGLPAGRVILERAVVHIPDIERDPEFEHPDLARAVGFRSGLFVPMLRDGVPIGVITVSRAEPGPFSDNEITLLQTFADQAVIAIENTRLFEAEQARTRELQESLEYQTATSEVLNVISRSKFDLQPVLDTIVEAAARLCAADMATIRRRDGEVYVRIASYGLTPDFAEYGKTGKHPLGPGSIVGRVSLEGTAIQVSDVLADPEYSLDEAQRLGGYRTILGVPLLREGVQIGIIVLMRRTVQRFTENQIELVTTFADQAVIAIENTRLFEAEQASKRELEESLEYQTATSEVLNVISRSPSEVQPIFDTIAKTARRLCQAARATIWRLENSAFQVAAFDGAPHIAPLEESLRHARLEPNSRTIVGRTAVEKRAVHVHDVQSDQELMGVRVPFGEDYRRTILGVPLLRHGEAVGVIVVIRSEVRPFAQKEIDLITTFADQAVIALENARLFEAEQASKRELQESLEQQMATADVLKVISRSALDVQKVLNALVESAARLCNAHDAMIFQVFGGDLRLVAHHGQIPTVGPVGQATVRLVRGHIPGRAVLERQTIQVADILTEADEYPESRKNALQTGYRTALCVPLVHAGDAIGAIHIRRTEVRLFTERQIELVSTFADQAVIAIENTRLFEEVQARTRELAKTVEDLEIASQHKSQFVANMSHELRTPLAAILGYAELMQEGFYEPQGKKSLDALTRIRSNGKHLLGLINTVLDIAKIESGQFTLNTAEYDIQSIVETVRSATESLAETKKLALKTEVAKSLPFGLGDEQRLTQVLLNLVGNAIKFTDAGEVRIAASAVNGHFNVTVTDTGPGIPEEHQARIFEQFHQVDNSNTKAKGGTGLGLAIAKQIVEMHGGRIWVESTVSKGSTFQMEIPTRAEFRKSAP